MKTRVLIALFILGSTATVYAQTAVDALRYSRIFYSGTSRFNALGGAFGAVGADFSTLATNPAGIGLYQSSEMTITIAPNVGSSSSTYNGTTASDSRVNFGMGNFGFVFNIKPTSKSGTSVLKSLNFGFGFNRQNDFNNRVAIQGVNMKNSLMQSYVNVLNEEGTWPGDIMETYPYDIGLAWDTYLIDTANGSYYCDAPYGGLLQRKTITTYGSMNELDFSFGGNIGDKLYFGFTVGVPFINYYENSYYEESSIKDTIPNFLSLSYNYNLQTKGTGVNVKFGLIYRPADWVRIGASIHTPTWYTNMHDEWFSSMQSSFKNTSWNGTSYSPVGYYDYKLRTPFRAMGSLAFIIGKYGLVSADYEYVNYSQASFNSEYYSYTEVNNEISSNYKSWGNIRFGTEWRISDFRIRGGFAYFSNPYTGNMSNTNNTERYQASGGLGFRSKYFFADVSYVWSGMYENYYLYDASMVSPAKLTLTSHTVLTTIGFRF
jgi:hypothetical protein